MECVKAWRRDRHGRTSVHQVTDARISLSDDIRRREIGYVIKMSVRVICLILAAFYAIAGVGALLALRRPG